MGHARISLFALEAGARSGHPDSSAAGKIRAGDHWPGDKSRSDIRSKRTAGRTVVMDARASTGAHKFAPRPQQKKALQNHSSSCARVPINAHVHARS